MTVIAAPPFEPPVEPLVEPPRAPARKSREPEMDLLRGVGIIGVVYIHAAGLLAGAAPVMVPRSWFRWCVPLFLMIGSYVVARSPRSGPGGGSPAGAVWRRLQRLAPPFLVWSLVYLFITGSWSGMTAAKLLTRHFSGYGWSGQYYFILLFQLAFLYPLIGKWRPGLGAVAVVFVIYAIAFAVLQLLASRSAFVSKIGDRPVLYWMPFVLLGFWFARNRDDVERFAAPIGSGVVALGVLAISLLPILESRAWLRWGNDAGFPYMQMSILGSSAAVFVGGWILARRGWLGGGPQITMLLGRYSLGIFCLNPLAVMALARPCAALTRLAAFPAFVSSATPIVAVPLVLALCAGAAAGLEKLGAGRLVK